MPLTVRFIDKSKNDPTVWEWDFGDGDLSNQQSPTHTYVKDGKFDVTLTVGNEFGDAFLEEIEFIIAFPNPTSDKPFTLNCEHSMKRGSIFGLEKLTMNVGDTENCTLKLTNHEPGKTVEVLSLLKKGLRSAVKVEPARSVTDENGELKITITAVRKGKDWAAWAVKNDRGQFKFNMKTYNVTGLAWGMFVEVK